jgi:hypothetical protein
MVCIDRQEVVVRACARLQDYLDERGFIRALALFALVV